MIGISAANLALLEIAELIHKMQQIVISEPNPDWAGEYRVIAEDLRALLKQDAGRIDHIGSTAVPGLAAKDVIDLQITVSDLTEPTTITRLTQAGYELRDEIEFDNLVGRSSDDPALQKRYLTEPQGQRPIHIHVRETGRLNQIYALLFRDYLRADATTRSAYAQIKRQLAARFPDNASAYYAIKDPYMDTIYQAACLWRDATSWTPDEDYL